MSPVQRERRARQRAALVVGVPGETVLLVLVGRHVLTSPWLVAVLFAAWGAVAVRGGFHNRRLWERFL